jgi:mannose-6-phosphate isomerase
VRPIPLAANQPRQFYRGGEQIAAFRGEPAPDDHRPEDWVASTVSLFGGDEGLARLPDGTVLRAAVRADPEAWLGAEHVASYGPDPAVLVKLLDAGERLPVHCHPDRAFAARRLGCRYGKTEAWVVLGTTGGDPRVHLGFSRDVRREEVDAWVAGQDAEAMLGAMHAVPVAAGDALLVPAGTPHAVGAGVFLVELQEPTDFSVMLEWASFGLADRSTHQLGLPAREALGCLDLAGLSPDALGALRTTGADPRREEAVSALLPAAADPFFRAELVRGSRAPLEPGFAVLVVTDGAGRLRTEAGDALDLRRGGTVLVPYAAGATYLDDGVSAVRARPPAPVPDPAPSGTRTGPGSTAVDPGAHGSS